jgi:hypothetical protein
MNGKLKKRKTVFSTNSDRRLYNLFVVLLLCLSILSLLFIKDYVGYYAHQARAGSITKMVFLWWQPAYEWQGFSGAAVMDANYNNTLFAVATNAGTTEINLIFPCLQPKINHEIYASTYSKEEIDWGNVTAGTTALVDSFLGISSSSIDSAANTFVSNMTIQLGARIISNIPTAYTKQLGIPSSTNFKVGILKDINNKLIFVSPKTSFTTGFNGRVYNYQMMVPVPNGTTPTYYFYADPYDECPAGLGEYTGYGNIEGYVRDNQTGILLENVIVNLAGVSYVTGADGFYNLSVVAGIHNIIAMKLGYSTYFANVTIEVGNTTYHNISMNAYTEPLTGTGSGIGTGIGPGVAQDVSQNVGPGIGPGVGPGIGPYIEKPVLIEGIDYWISIDRIFRKIRVGNFVDEVLVVKSFKKDVAKLSFDLTGNVTQIIKQDKTKVSIDPDMMENVTLTIFGIKEGTYTGNMVISGDIEQTIPIKIEVIEQERLQAETLLMQLDLITKTVFKGSFLKFRLDLHNLLIGESYNISLVYSLEGVNNTLKTEIGRETIDLYTSTSIIRSYEIPKDWKTGDYRLTVQASYLGLNSFTNTLVEVTEPFYLYSLFGVLPIWLLFVILLGLSLILMTILIIRARIESKKRFHVKVDYNQLPKPGPRSIFVGKIAETDNKTYFDMDLLTVHSIVAGSTGGGKTISAQVIIEECLMKGIAVIVFDPTAQWSGMLRKCDDPKMLSHYSEFGLKKDSAKAFNGNVRAITNAREIIDIKKYVRPGEIQILTVNTLDPSEIDTFVANTVRQVFKMNFPEARELKLLLVYDEVHRLLPKFGGSGEGFIQIERACREFRKWGIGVVLISQVLADFVGQIKANINTEVQMKTRDEGDLERIKNKYGASNIVSLVKSPVGSGMVQNSAYNRGNPYFVTFRPILHSVKRLSDDELQKYNHYNEIVDDIEFQLEQLEAEGQDIFDLKLELKLSTDKIKQGAFNMVDIYLEGLTPRVQKLWEKLGKTPKKRELKLVSEEELKKEMDAAKKSREEYEKQQQKDKPKEEAEKKEDGPLKINEDVAPNKILKLKNDMLVLNLKSLSDELKAMDPASFKYHVNEEKNDFANWIRDAVRDKKLADKADKIITKEDMLGLLEAKEQGKEDKYEIKQPIERKASGASTAKSNEEKKEEKKEATKEQKETNKDQTVHEKKPEQRENPSEEKKIEQKESDKKQKKKIKNNNVPQDNYFHLSDGKTLKNLADLYDELKSMDENIFRQHVNNERNDFASWIKYVIKDEDLADKVNNVKSRDKMMKIIDDEIE